MTIFITANHFAGVCLNVAVVLPHNLTLEKVIIVAVVRIASKLTFNTPSGQRFKDFQNMSF
jgi:hypothetical protein